MVRLDDKLSMDGIRGLTYNEVHAFTFGFGLVFFAITAGLFVPVVFQSLFLLAGVLAIYGLTGDETIANNARLGKVERYVLVSIRKEVHYYLFGMFAGFVSAGIWAVLFGAALRI